MVNSNPDSFAIVLKIAKCLGAVRSTLKLTAAYLLITCDTASIVCNNTIKFTGLPKAPVFQSGLLSKMSTSHTLSWSTESHERITEYRLTYRKIMVRGKCQVSSVSNAKCQISSVKCQVSRVECQVSSVKCQVSSFKCQVSSVKCVKSKWCECVW